jgi:hypothetical protein
MGMWVHFHALFCSICPRISEGAINGSMPIDRSIGLVTTACLSPDRIANFDAVITLACSFFFKRNC